MLFRASPRVGRQAGKPAAEATQQRSIPDRLHLAMLEPVYRLAPDLLRSGRVRPPQDVAATRELRMTDFRLLRPGGFYHALARYGLDLWTPFTYAGLHATERSLRRKEQHRFWGADRYFRIGNRLFYEDPDQTVELRPSRDLVSDPAGHPTMGRPEQVGLWLREIPTWKPSTAERPTGCL